MPRTRERQRCETCRQRRVKCDSKWPECTPCVKSGWRCPGPSIDYLFVNQDEPGRPGPSTPSRRPSNSALTSRASTLVPTQVHASSADTLRLDLVRILQSNVMAVRLRYLNASAYMRYMPSMIGTSACLDAAVRCVCTASNELIERGISTERASAAWRTQYATALTLLQGALNDPAQAVESETMATALVLEMLEYCINGPAHGAKRHSDGLSHLIQFRGPAAFKNPIDFAALEVEAPNINCAYYQNRSEHFLAQESWQGVWQAMIDMPSGDQGRLPVEDLCMVHVTCLMPKLIESFKAWTAALDTFHNAPPLDRLVSAAVAERAADLYHTALLLREKLAAWDVGGSYDQATGLHLGMATSRAVHLVVVCAYLETLLQTGTMRGEAHRLDVLYLEQQLGLEAREAAEDAISCYSQFKRSAPMGAEFVVNFLRLVWRSAVMNCSSTNPMLRQSSVLEDSRFVGLVDNLELERTASFA